MRDDYIKLIKEYISIRPDYKHTLEDIRKNTMLIHATEDEFNEAIKQLTGIPSATAVLDQTTQGATTTSTAHLASSTHATEVPSEKPRKKKSWRSSKALAGIAACLLVLLVGSVYVKLAITTTGTRSQIALAVVQIPQQNHNPIPQVYASTKKVDAKQVFSFPPKNVSLVISGKPKKEIVGFLPYYMFDNADQISIDGLTTINLFGITFDGKGNIVTQQSDGTPDGGWVMWNNPKLPAYITSAKGIHNVKVALTLKCFNNADIENLVKSDDAQKRFISNALYMVGAKNLDGINIDFEYTGTPPEESRNGFTRLITNLRSELSHEYPSAILTIDTYIVSGQNHDLFDIEALADKADALILMGYDIHTPNGGPGPIAPMQGDLNIIGLVQNYLEKVPADKIILAVPYYGYDWIVGQPQQTPGVSSGTQVLPYAQIVDASRSNKVLWDDNSQTPYYTYNDASSGAQHEVYFENVRSLGIKYDFINKKELQGVGIWALGYDGLNTDLHQLLADKFMK